MDRFYERLAEILEEDKVGPDDVLANFEQWDSLTALSVVAMIDEHYAVARRSARNLVLQALHECPAGQPPPARPQPTPAKPRWFLLAASATLLRNPDPTVIRGPASLAGELQ
jgi:acyl carrier protein